MERQYTRRKRCWKYSEVRKMQKYHVKKDELLIDKTRGKCYDVM